MKENSIKKFDEVGRIVIPREMRSALGWCNNTKIAMFQVKDGVLLKAYQDNCFACGNEEDILSVHKKFICKKCVDELSY